MGYLGFRVWVVVRVWVSVTVGARVRVEVGLVMGESEGTFGLGQVTIRVRVGLALGLLL